jgi:hypothetical protein
VASIRRDGLVLMYLPAIDTVDGQLTKFELVPLTANAQGLDRGSNL